MKVGGAEGGKIVKVGSKDKPFDDIVRDHWSELVKMLEAWRDPGAATPRGQSCNTLRYSDYDHLARVKGMVGVGRRATNDPRRPS